MVKDSNVGDGKCIQISTGSRTASIKKECWKTPLMIKLNLTIYKMVAKDFQVEKSLEDWNLDFSTLKDTSISLRFQPLKNYESKWDSPKFSGGNKKSFDNLFHHYLLDLCFTILPISLAKGFLLWASGILLRRVSTRWALSRSFEIES